MIAAVDLETPNVRQMTVRPAPVQACSGTSGPPRASATFAAWPTNRLPEIEQSVVWTKLAACTPMQYLQRVRLQRAHRDLQAADPKQGASVAAIAARWGFGNARSFAASYRQIYQKAPSTTLRT
jgi:transcriptional regulator GlxA family with amidase domain